MSAKYRAFAEVKMSDEVDSSAIKKISLIPHTLISNSCDAWGNIQGEPFCVVAERHSDYSVKIFIYCVENRFYYGYQINIKTMIRQKTACVNDRSFGSADYARSAASIEIEKACNENKNVRKAFADFVQIRYNQGSLFEGM